MLGYWRQFTFSSSDLTDLSGINSCAMSSKQATIMSTLAWSKSVFPAYPINLKLWLLKRWTRRRITDVFLFHGLFSWSVSLSSHSPNFLATYLAMAWLWQIINPSISSTGNIPIGVSETDNRSYRTTEWKTGTFIGCAAVESSVLLSFSSSVLWRTPTHHEFWNPLQIIGPHMSLLLQVWRFGENVKLVSRCCRTAIFSRAANFFFNVCFNRFELYRFLLSLELYLISRHIWSKQPWKFSWQLKWKAKGWVCHLCASNIHA